MHEELCYIKERDHLEEGVYARIILKHISEKPVYVK